MFCLKLKVIPFLYIKLFQGRMVQVTIDKSIFFENLVCYVLSLQSIYPFFLEFLSYVSVRCKSLVHFMFQIIAICSIVK